MPNFPTKEADINELAFQMALGYLNHQADFPSVSIGTLLSKYTDYFNARKAVTEARAAKSIATAS